MRYSKITALVIVIATLVCHEATAVNLLFIPRGGYSVPAGEIAGTWQPGYTLELDIYSSVENNLCFGVRLGYHRWTPNAEEMLRVGSREFVVEQNQGWQAIGELSGLVSYRSVALPKKLGSIRAEGGLGVCSIKRPDIFVKGFHVTSNTALNHDVSMNEKKELKPGISVGLQIDIAERIVPAIRYHYIFTSEEGTGILMFGIGLMAH